MATDKLKTVFFGTHTFAATILEGLFEMPFLDITHIITQPDQPVGRKQELQKPAVKLLAEARGIPFEQPPSLKTYKLLASNHKLGIVAQYGLIIPKHILDTPTHGLLNTHTSLLPKYRGASPIQTALMNGETRTGVTIMKMDEGLDTGPILLQKSLIIGKEETYPVLEARLARLAVMALEEAIPKYVSGTLPPVPQKESEATMTKILSRDDGKIAWQRSATDIYNQYRGLTPWPGVWTTWNGKRLKLLSIQPLDDVKPTGTVTIADNHFFIGCGTGAIEVFELQLEGKKPMDTQTFLNGFRDISGAALE